MLGVRGDDYKGSAGGGYGSIGSGRCLHQAGGDIDGIGTGGSEAGDRGGGLYGAILGYF